MELFSFNGSLQRVEDEREVESPGSLDSRIRKGILRYIITYSSAATADRFVCALWNTPTVNWFTVDSVNNAGGILVNSRFN